MNRPENPGWYWVTINTWLDENVPGTALRQYGRRLVCIHVERYQTGLLQAWVFHMDYAEDLPLFEDNYGAEWIREAL